MEQPNLIETIEVIKNYNGARAILGPKMAAILLYLAREYGIRGSSTKNKRIQKKVINKMFNIVLREYINKYQEMK